MIGYTCLLAEGLNNSGETTVAVCSLEGVDSYSDY